MKLLAAFARPVFLFLGQSIRSPLRLLLVFFAATVSSFQPAYSQAVPSVQGSAVADPAIPTMISPASGSAGYFVLNQDLSLISHSSVDPSFNQSCAAPAGFSGVSTAPRTLVSDAYNAYLTAQSSTRPNIALTAISPEVSCGTTPALSIAGGTPTQSLAANNIYGGYYFLVSAFGGTAPDTLTVVNNLNRGTSALSQDATVNLDTGARYTSVVTDTRSDFSLAAVTELKTSTSPGNLWVFDPITNKVFKILGPGGVALPAVTSFIIPAQTDGGGSLLVLVNQDGLTADNINAPPADSTPFTIIDLGQLRPVFATVTSGNTITLPFVTQINATTPFYAMLGAAYNPIDHRAYAVVAGASATEQPVEYVISYDVLNPTAPGEIVVADVSNVPFSFQAYPQLALNAASGTMQILTSDPAAIYSVGITGTGNAAIVVPGSTFPDSNFQPTFITANPLQGETYIASQSGQVDVLTRPVCAKPALTVTLTGSDLGYTSQPYTLKILALFPTYDPSLGSTTLTVTATPKGGTPFTFVSGHVSDYGYPGGGSYDQMFPAAGEYTLVATAAASDNYAAVTSPPLHVFVGNTGVYPTAVTLTLPATSSTGTLNATVNLTGTTYAPTGEVLIQDTTGAVVGEVILPDGVISPSITVPITLNEGTTTLTATYTGDEQNQAATSVPSTITVGAVTRTTPTVMFSVAGTAASGAMVSGNVKLIATSSPAPTGAITIYSTAAGSTTVNAVATVTAAEALGSSGANFSFTAGSAGTYSLFAAYAGDGNFNNANSAPATLTVSAAALIPATVGLIVPAAATAGTAFNVVVAIDIGGRSSIPPTGTIMLTAAPAGGASTLLQSVTVAQAMAPGGYNAAVTLPNAGMYVIGVAYAGDAIYAGSSDTANLTVAGLPTTLTIKAPASPTVGSTFNTVVSLAAAGSTSMSAGNVVLMATPKGGQAATIATITAARASASSGAAVAVTLTTVAPYTLTATYSGAGPLLGSTANATVSVSQAVSSLKLTGPSSATVSSAANYVVTLTGVFHPTGSVTVVPTVNGVSSTAITVSATQAAAAGGATVPLSFTSAGTYSLSAGYQGDSNNFGGTADDLSVAVTAPVATPSFTLQQADPNMTVYSPPVQVPASSSATVPFVLTLINGYQGNVTLTASSDLYPLSGGTDDGGVRLQFVDPNGKPLCTCDDFASVYVTPPNLKFGVFIRGAASQMSKQRLTPSEPKGAPLLCLLLGVVTLARFKSRSGVMRKAQLLCAVLMLGACGTLLTGCSPAGEERLVTITAAGSGGITQSARFLILFGKD